MANLNRQSESPLSTVAPEPLRLIFFARDPRPDVGRTVAKRDPVALARTKKPNSVSIHEDDILEIQHDGLGPAVPRPAGRTVR